MATTAPARIDCADDKTAVLCFLMACGKASAVRNLVAESPIQWAEAAAYARRIIEGPPEVPPARVRECSDPLPDRVFPGGHHQPTKQKYAESLKSGEPTWRRGYGI